MPLRRERQPRAGVDPLTARLGAPCSTLVARDRDEMSLTSRLCARIASTRFRRCPYRGGGVALDLGAGGPITAAADCP